MSDTQFTPAHAGLLDSVHQDAQNRYAATGKALGHMVQMGEEMAALAKLGDTVTPEDVISGAGKIVAQGGASPVALAGLLADMPQGGGPGLAAWVAGHAQTLTANVQQISAMHNQNRHQLGVAALHSLAAQARQAPGGAPAMAPQAPGSALAPQAGMPPQPSMLH